MGMAADNLECYENLANAIILQAVKQCEGAAAKKRPLAVAAPCLYHGFLRSPCFAHIDHLAGVGRCPFCQKCIRPLKGCCGIVCIFVALIFT